MKKKRGFTLIELLIVVAVVTILAFMALFAVRQQMAKARDARRKADIHKIQEAVEEYEKDHDCYPASVLCTPEVEAIKLRPYLNIIPCDPLTGDSYKYEPSGPVCASWYRLFAILEYERDKDLRPGIGPGSSYNFYQASPNAPIPVGIPVPTPSLPPQGNYYGCKSGVCVQVPTNAQGTGPSCLPAFDNPICNVPGNCGTPANPHNECL